MIVKSLAVLVCLTVGYKIGYREGMDAWRGPRR